MKIKALLVLAATLIVSLLKAQDYEIVSVEPTKLTAGTVNDIKIVFDQKLSDEDKLEWAEIWKNDHAAFEEGDCPVSGEDFNNDSVYFASCSIPKGFVYDNCILVFVIVDFNMGSFVGVDTAKFYGITIDGGIAGVDPEICMVSTDSSGRNMVIWEPGYEKFVDSAVIYKETAVADEFEVIGKKSIEETSVFIDEESENAQNSNRYKLAYMDTIGDISSLSAPHKTIHLLMSAGINGSINLIWDKYEGFEYSTFHIYRGSSKQEMLKIAELASNIFTYSDLAPPLGNLYYQVVIENPSPCDITQSKSAQDIFSSTKSNFVEYAVVSNEPTENAEYAVSLYPNPVSDFLSVRIENSPVTEFDMEIHDLSGRSVLNYSSGSNDSKIDLSGLKAGMYIVTVKSDGINQNRIISKD